MKEVMELIDFELGLQIHNDFDTAPVGRLPGYRHVNANGVFDLCDIEYLVEALVYKIYKLSDRRRKI